MFGILDAGILDVQLIDLPEVIIPAEIIDNVGEILLRRKTETPQPHFGIARMLHFTLRHGWCA
jgi:hypothetical protein